MTDIEWEFTEIMKNLCPKCKGEGTKMTETNLAPSLKTMFDDLDQYTARPNDGDYDKHVKNAMEAVYFYMIGGRKND